MKNVHLLPTDKLIKSAGDLVKDKYGSIHIFTKNDGKEYGKTTTKLNIYITSSDEEIKEGDWVISDQSLLSPLYDAIGKVEIISLETKKIIQSDNSWYWTDLDCKKIVLTTDQDLIDDRIQPIEDYFLEWFVKNPSCEFVEVGYGWIGLTETNNEGYWISIPDNKLELKIEELKQEYAKCTCANSLEYSNCGKKCERILDEQDPKQETIEEAAEMYAEYQLTGIADKSSKFECVNDFIAGAKSDAARDYWFEQFKKK